MAGTLRLPSTLRGYMAFLASLLVLAFTMTLHIMLSAEIMRLNVQLQDLQSEHALVERYNSNIVWGIAERSSLVDLHKEAVAAGYVNTIPTEYVDMPVATTFTTPSLGASTSPRSATSIPATGALATQGSVGAIDATVTDPAAPQPQFVVISGEPAATDPNPGEPGVNGQETTGVLQDGSVTAPRVGALAANPAGETQTGASWEPTWWEQNVPEWLRFNRVGDAIDETIDWIRETMPSPEWLQQRW
jgi:hypothetical protein